MNQPLHKEDLDRPVRDFATPVETSLRMDWTISQALDSLRQRDIPHQVTYFYIVDGDGKLHGVLPSRKLLLSPPDARLADLTERMVVSLPETMTLAEAMEEFAIHRLLALPVVDAAGKLMGIIDVQLYAEEAVDLAEANRVSDLFQMIGVRIQQLRKGGLWPSFNARLPWLIGNIVGGLTCAVIAAVFQAVLAKIIMLAMFIPLVLTLSESISVQSMTLTLQFLHGSSTLIKRLKSRLGSEWRTAVLLAASCAVMVTVAATFWPGGTQAADVILLSIFLAMCFSATMGAAIPIVLHALKLDPKVAAGPVVLMLADVAGTFIYLGLATRMLL